MGVGGQRRPGRFTPGGWIGTHCIAGWVGVRAVLDRCWKFHPPHRDSIPGPSKPVASRYTDSAIPAHGRSILRPFSLIKNRYDLVAKNAQPIVPVYVSHYLFNYKHCCYFYASYSYWKVYEVALYGKSSGNTLLYRQTLKGCHFR